MISTLHDPMTTQAYDYEVRDNKEARLLEALHLALEDGCPPDHKDYLCLVDEAEEKDCDRCLLRYATREFGKLR